MIDQLVLVLTALGALGQGVPLLWRQDAMLEMAVNTKERAALSNSGFARWCLMAHQGCLHLTLAAVCIIAAALYAVRERFSLHILLFVYNSSSIIYHYRMWRQSRGVPTWFAEESFFWNNCYAICFSSLVNAIGVLAAYRQL
ncbi:unnamed protein product [Effrenium voratum]|nr:unnamed protein product [Effrenium voratum]